ncbi:hypothetical protein Dimus_028701, partial [Dionaea muscipula]
MLGHLEKKCKWKAPAPEKIEPLLVTQKVWRKVEKESKSDVVPVTDEDNEKRAYGSAGIENLSETDACLNSINPHQILERGNTGFELGGDSELNIDVVVQNRYDILKENNGEVLLMPDNHHNTITASQSRLVLVDSNARTACVQPKSGGDRDILAGKSSLKTGKSIDLGENKDPGRGHQAEFPAAVTKFLPPGICSDHSPSPVDVHVCPYRAKGDAAIVGLLMSALTDFASASGLHINQDKYSLFCASMDEQGADLLKSITGFQMGRLPFRYL